MKKSRNCTPSSGNIFADLGIPNPEEMLAKADLTIKINELIKQKKLTQAAAADLLGVDQPKISALNNGRLSGFSLERLFKFLNILDQKITIRVTPRLRSKKIADITVSVPKTRKVPLKKQPAQNTSTMHAQKKKGS